MKLNKLTKPLIISCLSSISLLASAEDKMNFVTLRAGVDQPVMKSDNANANSVHQAFVGGIEVGRKINDMFSVGLEYSRRAKSKFDIDDQYTYASDFQKTSSTWAVSSDVFMLNLITNLVQDSKITPYIKLGAGVASNKAHDYVQTNDSTETSTYPGETKRNFAWQLGAGLNTTLNDKFDVDFSYAYLDRGKVQTKAYFNNELNSNNPDAAKNVRLLDHTFTIGVKFKF
jgi:opacity protein-like surface antigen